MEKKYARAYTEVLQILKHIPKSEYEKIPKAELQFYENNCDKNYKYEYDETKDVKEQTISREANAVIVAIYMNYFANEKQKSIINEILKQNSIKAEKEKIQKYNPDNIFNNTKRSVLEGDNDENNGEKSNLPVKVEEQTFVKKIINKIKHLFAKS